MRIEGFLCLCAFCKYQEQIYAEKAHYNRFEALTHSQILTNCLFGDFLLYLPLNSLYLKRLAI